MAHEIEIFEETGEAAFVSAGQPGWHRLGTTYTDQAGLTTEQVLVDAHLGGWNVRAIDQPTVLDPFTGDLVVSEEDRMIIRTNPVTGKADHLGMTGPGWTPVQNEAHADFLQGLLDGGAGFDTAMSLRRGKTVIITMKLPAGILIGGVDRIDLYVAVINHHDGHGSFTVLVTPVRVVCANTQAAAMENFIRQLKIRHTSGMPAGLAEARTALDMSFAYADAFQAEADRMINEALTIAELEETIAKVFPQASDSKMAATMTGKRSLDIVGLFRDADTQANCRGTRWAGYQAIVEHVDYGMATRGADDPAAAMAARSLLGSVDGYKTKAFDLLRVPA